MGASAVAEAGARSQKAVIPEAAQRLSGTHTREGPGRGETAPPRFILHDLSLWVPDKRCAISGMTQGGWSERLPQGVQDHGPAVFGAGDVVLEDAFVGQSEEAAVAGGFDVEGDAGALAL